MDRFPAESASDLAHNHARFMAEHVWGESHPLHTVAVNVCENCGQSCERLIHVPEWDYLGCDTCYDEAMQIMADEAKAALTPKPPKVERMQGSLFTDAEVA